MGRSCNPTYVLPVCLVSLGAVCMAAGFIVLALLYSAGDLQGTMSGKSVYVMVLCGLGLLSLVLGSCSCCTLQQRAATNWHECQRLQRSHNVQLGRSVQLLDLCGKITLV